MVMIRRELPDTKHAGWVRKPFRIKHTRILHFVVPCAVIGSAVHGLNTGLLSRSGLGVTVLFFGVDGDGPNEP